MTCAAHLLENSSFIARFQGPKKSSNFLIKYQNHFFPFSHSFSGEESLLALYKERTLEGPPELVRAALPSCKWISLLDLLDTMRTDITNTDEEIRGKGQ